MRDGREEGGRKGGGSAHAHTKTLSPDGVLVSKRESRGAFWVGGVRGASSAFLSREWESTREDAAPALSPASASPPALSSPSQSVSRSPRGPREPARAPVRETGREEEGARDPRRVT